MDATMVQVGYCRLGPSYCRLRPVENVPDFRCQYHLGQGLLQQRHAGIQPALMHDGVSRIPGHEKHFETRLPVEQFVEKPN